MRAKTRLAEGVHRAVAMSGAPSRAEFARVAGVSQGRLDTWSKDDTEPAWLRDLRRVKRASGLTWEELLG